MVCVFVCVVQVADEFLAPDVLLTVKEMKVANFRRVSKMPIYGMAQPTAEVPHVVTLLQRSEGGA